MSQYCNILLASHGSEGAMAAETAALAYCSKGVSLRHIVVVPELWKGMMGDDWLNNGVSRDRFGRYLESEIGREVDDTCARVSQQCEAKLVDYSKDIVLGEPDDYLLKACQQGNFDLVVLGSPRPKGKSGLRSRMLTDHVIKTLSIPLLIVPYPHD